MKYVSLRRTGSRLSLSLRREHMACRSGFPFARYRWVPLGLLPTARSE
jgi:hypothetical protein